MEELNAFYLKQDEPIQGCLLALREIILSHDADVSSDWKYGMPFFNYRGKRFCYLSIHKKLEQPYIGIVDGNAIDHPDLIQERQSRMKILLLDPNQDLPIETINTILQQVIQLAK